jgi:O-antigen/teichoic acid export membrane protein
MTSLRLWAGRLFVGGLAPISVYGSRFASNIILSRLLAPDQFGTAVAISALLGLGSLATDVALDRFVMIDGTQRGLSTAHLVTAAIGLTLTGILVAAAPFTAQLFGVGNFAGSFALAAAISGIAGFANLGVKQIQRNYNYGPDAIAQVAANLAGLIALLIAAMLLRTHRAIIVGLGVQSVLYVLLSHLLSPTRYKMSCDRQTLLRALAFGLPLTLNGIGLATVSQVDRILVGHWFGVKELGLYAIVFSMSVVPTSLIISTFSGPSLSFLLSDNQDASARAVRYRLLLTLYALISGLYACWLAVSLDVLVPLIFGPAYRLTVPAHVLFVLISCIRLLRSGAPTSLLLADGKTSQLAALNLSAGIGLVVATVCITFWPTLESMLFGIVIGELIAFTLFFTTLGRPVREAGSIVADLVTCISAPVMISVALAWLPEPTWRSRGALLLIGLSAVAGQLYVELHRNAKFRAVFAEMPIIGRRFQSLFTRRVCAD